MRAFLSYAREDGQVARNIVKALEAAGHSVWFDENDMKPGVLWRDEVKGQINEVDYFIALVSSNSVDKRGYVQTELNQAMDVALSLPRHVRFIIPVLLDECAIRDARLLDYHRIDLHHGFEDGLKKLVEAISMAPERSVPGALTKVSDAKSEVNTTDATLGSGSIIVGDGGVVNNHSVAIDASMRGRGHLANISIEQKSDN